MAAIHATRALALVGTPFRAQGRDPAKGIDCIGLCILAYRLPSGSIRDDYRLRGDHRASVEAAIRRWFRRVPLTLSHPGDLLLMLPANDQVHLAIKTGRGFVHADAGLKRVVEVARQSAWPVDGIYRLRKRTMH